MEIFQGLTVLSVLVTEVKDIRLRIIDGNTDREGRDVM